MKILLTGANGLLGSEINRSLKNAGHKIIKLKKTPMPGFIAADLTDDNGIATVEQLDFDLMIHTAAERNPDICEKNKTLATAANVEASDKLSQIAKLKKAKLIYISTDYIFNGKNPPYSETDKPAPVNYYGKTKLAGEIKILAASPENVSLRVPAFYGAAAGIENCPLLYDPLTKLQSEIPFEADNFIIKYPTYAGDIARAIELIINKQATGIFHVSGNEIFTKYQTAVAIAELSGHDPKLVIPSQTMSKASSIRPLNCHLSMKRITALGYQESLTFKERIKKILKPFIQKN